MTAGTAEGSGERRSSCRPSRQIGSSLLWKRTYTGAEAARGTRNWRGSGMGKRADTARTFHGQATTLRELLRIWAVGYRVARVTRVAAVLRRLQDLLPLISSGKHCHGTRSHPFRSNQSRQNTSAAVRENPANGIKNHFEDFIGRGHTLNQQNVRFRSLVLQHAPVLGTLAISIHR